MADPLQTTSDSVEYVTRGHGERLAVSRIHGHAPGVIFFGGLRSDMDGAKALHVESVCRREGRACTRFDYSGHGRSGGRFEDGTISSWLADAERVVDSVGNGPHILVGSSLGGWLALLLAIEKPDCAAAIVGISAAADFTAHVRDRLFSDTQRTELATDGRVLVPDCHGGPPFVITRDLIEDGERHLLLNRTSLPIKCPVRLICARTDRDIPWDTGLKLSDKMQSEDVQVTVIKDGEHQLARPSDRTVLETALVSMFHSTPKRKEAAG